MTKSDQIMEALTKNLENRGVLVETTDNNLTTFIGMSNKRKASIVHPFYGEDENVSEAETQIRMGGSNQE